jgi:hypothetical protein
MSNNSLLKLSLFYLVLGFLLSCSGDSGNDITLTPKSATLTWKAPTEHEDGSPLGISQLVRYRIYYGTEENSLSRFHEINAQDNLTSYTFNYTELSFVNSTTYYIAMSAINSEGIESALSEIVTFTPG